MNWTKVLIVALVTALSLALGTSGALASHKQGRESRPQINCEYVLTDQADRHNKRGQPSTNCDHVRNP